MLDPENPLLTATGPGTAMGELMRRYWIPALKSDELQALGPPIRLRLLGENLVAFRSGSGEVGIMDHRCPHRLASLFFGRNEQQGLRCVYHGWQFDPGGRCVDMPSEPGQSDFKDKVRAAAYPTRERGGLVWTYMGPDGEPPSLPDLEANMLPEGEGTIRPVLRECNWLQALEGDIDTAHFGFLHLGSATPEQLSHVETAKYYLADRSPKYEVRTSASGTMYGAYRPAEAETNYWRVAQFLFPFWTMPPAGPIEHHVIVRAWVPLDDSHTMFWNLSRKRGGGGPLRASPAGRQAAAGLEAGTSYLENTSDWLGRWRLAANARNDYEVDRTAQREASYTGIRGIHLQDQAITESMGPIAERAGERLASSDQMIIQTRRRLLEAAKALRDEGRMPPGSEEPDVYSRVRSGEMVLPRTADWTAEYEKRRNGEFEGS